jgi:hypothetical protein
MNDFTGLGVFKSNNLYIKLYETTKLLKTRWVSGKRQYLVKLKDNSPPSWQHENNVSEALKAAFHTAKALIKSKNS